MRFVNKRVLTQAVVASTLLWGAGASYALTNVTTDITATITDNLVNISPGTTDGGSLDVGGTDIGISIVGAVSYVININPTTSTVADGFSARSFDGNLIDMSVISPAPGAVNIAQGAKVTTTGAGNVFNTNQGILQNITNAGSMTAAGTGVVVNVGGVAGGNVSVTNALTGTMSAGLNSNVIDFGAAFAANAAVSNAGIITATGTGIAINTPTTAITGGVSNSGTITADALLGTAIESTAIVTNVVNAGTISALTAINTDGNYTQKSGSITGAINFNANNVVTVSGGVVNSNITQGVGFKTDFTVNPAVGTAVTFNGTLTSDVVGTLTLGDSSVATINGALTNLNVVMNKASTLNLNASLNTAGNFTNNLGTLNVNRAINIPGTFVLTTDSSTNLTINDKNNFGQINSTGGATLAGTVSIILGNGYIFNNDTFNIFNSTPALVNNLPIYSFQRSAILGLTQVTNANNVVVTATRRTLSSFVGTDQVIAGIASEMDRLGSTFPNPGYNAALRGLESLPTNERVVDALIQLAPRVDGASLRGVINAQHATNETVNKRLTLARNDDGSEVSGYAAGSAAGYAAGSPENLVVWLQAYGNSSNQDLRRQVPGYRAKTLGAALGIDKAVTEFFRLGAAVNHGTTNTKAKLIPTTSHQIQSYGAILYSSYSRGCSYYDVLYTYATNMFHSVRRLNFGILNQTIDSDHRGSQMGLNATWGMPLMQKTEEEGWNIGTSVTASWDRVKERAYTERNQTGLNLRIQRVIDNSVMLKANLKFDYYYGTELGTLIPSVKVGASYDVMSKKPIVIAAFMPGGANFRTEGAQRSRIAGYLGASAVLAMEGKTRIDLSYDLESRQNYLSHSGMFTVRYVY